MQKRVVSMSIKGLSIFQISLLISMSFAFSFILAQELPLVSSATPLAAPSGSAAKAVTGKLGIPGTGIVTATNNFALGHLYTGIGHALIVATLVGLAARLFGADASTANALTIATGLGILAYHGALALFGTATTAQVAAATAISSLANAGTLAAAQTSLAGMVSSGALTPAAANAALAAVTPVGTTVTAIGGTGTITGTLAAGATATPATLAGAAAGATPGVTLTAGGQATTGGIFGSGLSTGAAVGIAIGIAIIAFVVLYKKVKQEVLTFQCLPWEPPIGGNKCEECNKDPLRPCSEYRCKSLGQACQLLNANTDNAQCAWVNRGDTQSPTISQWNEALRPTTLQYSTNNALRPGARGVKIVNPAAADGCLPAFTNLQFGILTNEPAQCKLDYNRSISFDSMQYYFGENNYYQYNHTQKVKVPSKEDSNFDLSPILQNDGTFSFFVRCRDVNGNTNVDEYSINYCVAAGPDTTPPIIEGSSLEDGSPVQFGADTVPIEIYTNEPAQCKWSTLDKSYRDMENFLGCAQDASQINANLQYTCIGALTGVKNTPTGNDFYFRCEDQPTLPENDRNQMLQSYKISLRGTEPLSLLRLAPNATTITANTNSVEVELTAETDDGADNGVATCYFSPTGQEGTFVEYYETDSITHSQTLALSAGNYTYFTRCVDLGGNAASGNVSFSVTVDKNMPAVTRIYKVGTDILQLITNEPAECFYSRTSCNYETEEGLRFGYPAAGSDKMHVAGWNSNAPYYVKCRDPYGNEPSPNACSIIVNGVDLSVTATAG